MNIEDRYTAVPTAHGGVRLIPKSIATIDAASASQRGQRLVRARAGDDVLTGNLESPKRISAGKTFGPAGEGRLDHADGKVYELQPHRNNALGVPVRAESVESVRSQISLIGGLPQEARGPDYPVPQPVRPVVVNEHIEAEDVEFVMREFQYAYAEAVQTLSRMPPTDRKLWLQDQREIASKRAAAMKRRTADNAARAQYRQGISEANAYKQRQDDYAASKGAEYDQTHGLVTASATADRARDPVRANNKYDAMTVFKANMDRAHAAGRSA